MQSSESKNIINCLQKVTIDDQHTIEGLFVFPHDFPAFEGHFPDRPILPAVVQLAATRLLAAKQTGHKLLPAGVLQAKFKKTIEPGMLLTIRLKIKPDKNNVFNVSFTISTDQGTAAVGEIQLRKHGA